jgi:hypothetical protein
LIGGPPSCDFPGCTAVRREVNFWYVVTHDLYGAHIYKWDTCPPEAMKTGNHYCGLGHALQAASKALTPDTATPGRESTLELNPVPLHGPAATQDTPTTDEVPDDETSPPDS